MPLICRTQAIFKAVSTLETQQLKALCLPVVRPCVRACGGILWPACCWLIVLNVQLVLWAQWVKKVKVAHTQLSSAGFRSWSRFLAVSLQATWVINLVVGCHYFRQACSYPCNPEEDCCQFCCLVNTDRMGANSLPKTVTRQYRGCDFNPGPSAPKSSMLTTRLLSHPATVRQLFYVRWWAKKWQSHEDWSSNGWWATATIAPGISQVSLFCISVDNDVISYINIGLW